MAFRRSIRARRDRKKINRTFELPLTAMMDILVIMVVFLLKSYSASTNSFTSVKGLQLPESVSEVSPPDSLQLIVTPEGMTFEGQLIVQFNQTPDAVGGAPSYELRGQDTDEAGRRIVPLYDALVKARDKSELLRAKSTARDANGQPLPFEGILAITADKKIQYDLLRKVMYTAAVADYRIFRFLALRREQ